MRKDRKNPQQAWREHSALRFGAGECLTKGRERYGLFHSCHGCLLFFTVPYFFNYVRSPRNDGSFALECGAGLPGDLDVPGRDHDPLRVGADIPP